MFGKNAERALFLFKSAKSERLRSFNSEAFASKSKPRAV